MIIFNHPVDSFKGAGSIEKEGMTFWSHNGSPIQNPAVTILHSARKDMMRILSEFGMTPSSRTKVQALPGGKKDEFGDFLGETG